MKNFFKNLFGKKTEQPKIQKWKEPVRQKEPQCETDNLYKRGDLIGNEYDVREFLGKGGFGLVYRVRSCEKGNVFAMKTFREEFLDDPKARDAFKKEALLWVNLEDHPFILSAKFAIEISGRLFVFMKFIAPDAQGRVNLADHLFQTVGPLDTKQTLNWAIQFCLGMEHAIAHGIQCHRDIKPANILISQDGTLQIGDFGLSRAAETAWSQSHSQNGFLVKGSGENGFSLSLMQSNGKIRSGTPGYMAPEVFRFEGADIRSDIYSFGLVLWQMVSGSCQPPFMVPWRGDMGSFLQGIYEQQMTGHAPRMKGPLVLVIDCCLRPDPSERFGSFRELRKVLEPIFEKTTGRRFEKPQLEKHTADFWHNKGASFAALKQFKDAIDCYDKAIMIDSQDAYPWNGKGVALLELGQEEAAIKCFDNALAINPQDDTAWSNKGGALNCLGRHEEAINCFEKALAVDPRNMRAWSNKAGVLRTLARYEAAIICHEKALAIDSRYVNAWTGKGRVLCQLGRDKEAINCYDKALAINPLDATIWVFKGIALHDFNQQIVCFSKAIEIDPQYASAFALKGSAFHELGKFEEALDCYNKALAIDPRNALVWNYKGNILNKLGRYVEAINCYDKELTIDSRKANTWLKKALCEDNLQQKREAIISFRKFVELEQDANHVAIARQRIQELEQELIGVASH
jgi:tetratricopeptide (TPR) repeat protein